MHGINRDGDAREYPTDTLRATRRKMTPAAIQSIVPNDTAIAAMRTSVMAFKICRMKIFIREGFFGGLSSFGPF